MAGEGLFPIALGGTLRGWALNEVVDMWAYIATHESRALVLYGLKERPKQKFWIFEGRRKN